MDCLRRIFELRRALACVTWAIVAGCAPVPPEPAPAPAPLPPIVWPEPVCPACLDQSLEIARLRQDLASREAELRDLRTNQRDQVKAIQESTRDVTRAKAKLRRLATQADAASYLAEVEVTLKTLRQAVPPAPPQPMLAMAEGLLESSAAPFAQGDYGTAMDRAAQAEQLVGIVADNLAATGARARVPGEIPLHVTVPLKVVIDSHIRREPAPRAPVIVVVRKGTPVTAQAYKGSWMRVETEDGRTGWISQTQLGAR